MISLHDAELKSKKQGSSASFQFFGSAVSIHGTAGAYSVSLDGTSQTFDGHGVADQLLFNASALATDKQHTISINNTGSAMSIDYFQFQAGLDDHTANASFTIDDTNSTISYQPPNAWNSSTSEGQSIQ